MRDQDFYDCLAEFMRSRGLELSTEPMDHIIIPTKDGDQLLLPVLFAAK